MRLFYFLAFIKKKTLQILFIFFIIILKYLFIQLHRVLVAGLGISDLHCGMWDLLVMALKWLVAAWGI